MGLADEKKPGAVHDNETVTIHEEVIKDFNWEGCSYSA
jgi:hypothetical protein